MENIFEIIPFKINGRRYKLNLKRETIQMSHSHKRINIPKYVKMPDVPDNLEEAQELSNKLSKRSRDYNQLINFVLSIDWFE
ncbi:MAG: hypothetical protein PF487_09025 [Bacteroidales bacterium]|jgi:hypothetical protein|nr:hypothetical protein [Bacteroidales bacterium]